MRLLLCPHTQLPGRAVEQAGWGGGRVVVIGVGGPTYTISQLPRKRASLGLLGPHPKVSSEQPQILSRLGLDFGAGVMQPAQATYDISSGRALIYGRVHSDPVIVIYAQA